MGRKNIKLYDIDNCLYHTFIPTGQHVEDWLIDTNETFFKREIENITQQNFDEVILAYITNRQDFGTDVANSSRGGTMAPALPLIQSYFQAHTTQPIYIDPFLMADLYNDLAAGTSYKKILQDRYKNENVTHARFVFDDNKISMLYAFIHRATLLNPNCELVIDFFDDSTRILNSVSAFFHNYPRLLPRNVTLNINCYVHGKQKPITSITGIGDVDAHFDWSVKYLASQNLVFLHDVVVENGLQLKEFHLKQSKGSASVYWRMCIDPYLFNYKKFWLMRNEHISKMESNLKITTEKNYLTATELAEEKLLPKKYVYHSNQKTKPLADSTHQELTTILKNYIEKRGYFDKNKVALTWVSQWFRNADLTLKKIDLANNLLQEIRDDRKRYSLLMKISETLKKNGREELVSNKKYWFPCESGLKGVLEQMMDKVEGVSQVPVIGRGLVLGGRPL